MWHKPQNKTDSQQKTPQKPAKPTKLPVKSTYLSEKPIEKIHKPVENHETIQRPPAVNPIPTPPPTSVKPSSNVQDMIERFRYSKPIQKEKRVTPNFWWNQSSDTESSEVYDDMDKNGDSDETVQSGKQIKILSAVNRESQMTKSKIFNENLNRLDMKTLQLIDRSESTLHDKLISSEGVGSSSTTTNLTSEFTFKPNTIIEPFDSESTFKPDFVRYLENKEKPMVYKSNEDILNQWRLRRKLEQAKTNGNINSHVNLKEKEDRRMFLFENIHTPSPLPTTRLYSEHTGETVTQRPQPQAHVVQPTKIVSSEISTQTVSDMAIQTSIERFEPKKHLLQGVPSLNPITVDDEMPTRDIDSNKKQKKNPKTSLKSPMGSSNYYNHHSASTGKHQNTKVSLNDDNKSDLTRVSSIFDSINQNHQNNVKSQVVTTNFVSSSTKSSLNHHCPQFTQKNQQIEPYIEDTIVYESDEILKMLFKKLFFYQSKLKDIEDLLQAHE